MSESPRSWFDQFVRGSVHLLVAVICLCLAVQLLRSLLPVLLTILGVIGLGGVGWLIFVVVRTTRQKW